MSCSRKIQVQSVKTDSISITHEIIHHDTAFVFKGDSVGITTLIDCPEYQLDTMATNGHLKVRLQVNKGVVKVSGETDSLVARIHWLESNQKIYMSGVVTQQVPVTTEVYKTPTWLIWYAVVCTLMLIIMNVLPVFMPQNNLLNTFLKLFKRG